MNAMFLRTILACLPLAVGAVQRSTNQWIGRAE